MEIWDLKVKGTDLTSYTQRFQELALLCGRMFPEESDKIEKYVGGLPDMIHGSVVASKPKTMQDAVEIATELMDKKICTFAECQTESLRKSTTNDNNANNQKGTGLGQKPTCYECGVQGHFKRECPKLKNNNNRGNQVRGGNAPAKVYVAVIIGLNHYPPTALDHDYAVELADGRIIGVNIIIRNCTLNILNHPFNIDLMPVDMGSFDVIIDMDWLSRYQAVIVYAEKIVHIPYENETLTVRVFLAHVTTKRTEDKSKEKRLEDVPIVRDFPEVFLEDLSGIPLPRQVKFRIYLVPGAALVAWAPYRLAPSEMKELSEQLKELSDKGIIRPSSSP
ncbi:putative reverse transcriptase domain-containing protein [Tanacetum coccineum]|uniref:Reverse transcriptase domain-containing protein n=1 Tax=Tanacetum coccineum TaxID=301880 RepID=A0ABQ5GG49_9ASTR